MKDSHQHDGSPRKRRFSDVEGGYDTIIGDKVTITGEVHGGCNVDMGGTLEGNIELEGILRLRQGGRIVGDVSAANVIIEGDVRGAVRAHEKAELRSACHVEGDLIAESVAIAEGGHFDGKITMAGRHESRQEVSFQEKRSDVGDDEG
jgi:cytoskeletal protein CcmA (bactofilin family)